MSRERQIWAPRVVQAVLAAIGDLYVFRLAERHSGARAARYAVRPNAPPRGCPSGSPPLARPSAHGPEALAGPVGRRQLTLSIVSWFNFYNGPRTLANNVETVLTTVALYYWPDPGTVRSGPRARARASWTRPTGLTPPVPRAPGGPGHPATRAACAGRSCGRRWPPSCGRRRR